MPFGFERKQQEKKMDNPDSIENRQYIEANAIVKRDGSLKPLSFSWEDEEVRVDRVISVKSGKSLKENTPGYVYSCRTGSKTYILGFDGERWYIEI